MKVTARAKVNLYLHIGPVRPDGYHNLQTVFHSISLADNIRLELSPTLDLACSDPTVPTGEANTCYQAAMKLREAARTTQGASIYIEKAIPTQAGLGGGSADAAACLVGLNALWHTGLGVEALEEIGAKIGADVPFCIRGGAAYAEGIGDKLRPLPPLANWIVVLKPDVAISTRLAYAELDLRAAWPAPGPESILAAMKSGILPRLAPVLYNDFEMVALELYPEVYQAYQVLSTSCSGVLLSGSGSALFGLAVDEREARRIAHDLLEGGWCAWASRLVGAGVVVEDGA